MPLTLESFGLDRLSRADRLALVQALWDSIADESPPLPDARCRELERRADEDDASPDDLIPWEVVKARYNSGGGAPMLNVTIPDELAGPLAEQAGRLGTTPELLVLDAVRRLLPPPPPSEKYGSMLEFLAGYVGTVEGTGEPFSQYDAKEFADDLAAGRRARP